MVTVCLLLPAPICDAVRLYLARDINSPLLLFDDGSAIDRVMDGEEEADGEQSRKNSDPWMWRAGIEGAGSHASDARLMNLNAPLHLASGIHRNGGEMWACLGFDRGRLPFEIVLPFIFTGPEVAPHAPCRPVGNASDAEGVGGWIGGKRSVEMSRALKTEHVDPNPFGEGEALFHRQPASR
jgi:hypothetical protein